MRKIVFWLFTVGLAMLFVVGCAVVGQPEETVGTALPAAETAVAPPGVASTAEDITTTFPEITPIVATIPVSEEATVPINPTVPTPSNPTIQRWLTLAQEDLANRLGIAADQIEVVTVELVTWSDSSLGCPQPDMAYIQVPQDGLLIQLRAGGQVYDYHGGGTQEPFLCEQPAADQKSTPIFGEDILTRPSPGDE